MTEMRGAEKERGREAEKMDYNAIYNVERGKRERLENLRTRDAGVA